MLYRLRRMPGGSGFAVSSKHGSAGITKSFSPTLSKMKYTDFDINLLHYYINWCLQERPFLLS